MPINPPGWCLIMQSLNELLNKLSHDYLLLTIGAILFFSVKAVLGYMTYRHYNLKLKKIEKMLDILTVRQK
jgi:hypothetical protein